MDCCASRDKDGRDCGADCLGRPGEEPRRRGDSDWEDGHAHDSEDDMSQMYPTRSGVKYSKFPQPPTQSRAFPIRLLEGYLQLHNLRHNSMWSTQWLRLTSDGVLTYYGSRQDAEELRPPSGHYVFGTGLSHCHAEGDAKHANIFYIVQRSTGKRLCAWYSNGKAPSIPTSQWMDKIKDVGGAA
eukprot:gnl/MRDRNA2_/MRDRNA2_113378_c0_seq1.p1 gnl/MRDRNA2_/MRDRNA2_113378_c0~~gnl/MRDRNA2_/MRDRNA2_113378_c0_seq1.p1  ORF type:complete len:184 (-),score=21.21 gnl/MRDRNA2_/MRDRNA2_113378_c0_seq1:26-577(-)